MKLFDKVAIVGTGLIGGSIALAIKKNRLAGEVIGVSRHKKNLLLAKSIGAIDRGSQDLGLIKGASLVILATPVNTIINLAPIIHKIIGGECIITDVGSTKEKIVKTLENIFPNYLGSHPLAGSEKRGIINAGPKIFKNSLCILTPTKKTNNKALNKLNLLWKQLGARTIILTPKMHDRILSFVSHLPHLAAFSLIDTIPKEYLKFASSGLRDTTRIASSDSELWVDIFLSNQKNMLKTIGALEENLKNFKSAIRRKDKRGLAIILEKAKIKRKILG